jgi:hypothetical protein
MFLDCIDDGAVPPLLRASSWRNDFSFIVVAALPVAVSPLTDPALLGRVNLEVQAGFLELASGLPVW